MANNQEKPFFDGKIVKENGPNKILECFSKLRPASILNYAHIHADGEEKNSYGGNIVSKLSIKLQEGSGDNINIVRVNISPEEAEYLYYGIRAKDETTQLDNFKIFGEPDKSGRCKANSLKLGFDNRVDKKGERRRSPWLIKLSEGTDVKKQNKNGGFYCEGNTY